jgi:hypothetical protein
MKNPPDKNNHRMKTNNENSPNPVSLMEEEAQQSTQRASPFLLTWITVFVLLPLDKQKVPLHLQLYAVHVYIYVYLYTLKCICVGTYINDCRLKCRYNTYVHEGRYLKKRTVFNFIPWGNKFKTRLIMPEAGF